MRKLVLACCAALAMLAVPAHAQTSATRPDDALRAEAREIYARAIAFQTTLSAHQNPELAAYLAGLFRAAGFPEDDVRIVPFGETAAFMARLRGDGTGGRPILFLAHMDVVEARREDWERDPFTLVEEGGFFFGRGAADNKAGLAVLAATFLDLRREGFAPTRDLVIVFTGDEETSGASARFLLAEHRDFIDAEFALNSDGGGGALSEAGEPMLYGVQTAEKSYASYNLTVRNPGGHSSLPRADNAIYELAEALARVRAYHFPVQWNAATIASFAAAGAQRQDALGAAMRRFAQRPGDRRAAQTISASPTHVGQLRTTCVPTLLSGGHADNALPQSATAVVNCRIFPGVSIPEVQAQLQRLAGPSVEIGLFDTEYYSSDASPLRADVMEAITAAVHANYPGIPIIPTMAAGATDGVFFRAAGVPTYGSGEIFIKDSDDFAHGLNERVPVSSFYNGLTHWRVLIEQLAGRR